MIPWHGTLRFKTYNHATVLKYGISVKMVCEVRQQVIFVTWRGQKKPGGNSSVIVCNLGLWSHIYQDIIISLKTNLFTKVTNIIIYQMHRSFGNKI
jgi:hypothetical protein